MYKKGEYHPASDFNFTLIAEVICSVPSSSGYLVDLTPRDSSDTRYAVSINVVHALKFKIHILPLVLPSTLITFPDLYRQCYFTVESTNKKADFMKCLNSSYKAANAVLQIRNWQSTYTTRNATLPTYHESTQLQLWGNNRMDHGSSPVMFIWHPLVISPILPAASTFGLVTCLVGPVSQWMLNSAVLNYHWQPTLSVPCSRPWGWECATTSSLLSWQWAQQFLHCITKQCNRNSNFVLSLLHLETLEQAKLLPYCVVSVWQGHKRQGFSARSASSSALRHQFNSPGRRWSPVEKWY